MSKETSTSRLVWVLAVISAVAAMALSFVFHATEGPIAEQRRLVKLEAIKAVLPAFDNEPDKDKVMMVTGRDKKGQEIKTEFYTAKKGGKKVGVAFTVIAKGFGGPVSIMMGMDFQGKLLGIKILRHTETPGLGAKISKKPFYAQFANMTDTNKMKIKKDGGTIDQISGASISSRAAATGVIKGVEFFKKNLKRISPGG
ncbi:MAG: RnfABCDGE type electron transport complex subunit G [bacterium]